MNGQSRKSKTDLSQRNSGVLLHITSLPNRYGIGDLGPAAHRWIEMLATANQRWWQMLPLGPVGSGNSPYQCFSVFAGNPAMISPDALVQDGLLSRGDTAKLVLPSGSVKFASCARNKTLMLEIAAERLQQSSHPLADAFHKFIRKESVWLDDFALFMALRNARPSQSWTDWPKPILRRIPAALAEARRHLAKPIMLHQLGQFLFFRQLKALRQHASDAGVGLVGDLPIFVSPDSVDVWTQPELFQLDRHRRPRAVAGVPPDMFSADGQRWGNPLYDWAAMAKDNFQWWSNRLSAALQQADIVRIDHFRGFESYWRIPADSPSAKNGKWVRAPGTKLFEAMRAAHPNLPVVAEDLGVITPQVEQLRDGFHLPGMRVLQFGFGDDPSSIHLPHHFVHHCFAYTGTHDNDTTAGWYKSLSKAGKSLLHAYSPEIQSKDDASWALIRLVWGSVANNTIVPVQDLLSLDSRSRMNIPGRGAGNWGWRLTDLRACTGPLHRLGELSRACDRIHPLIPGRTVSTD